MMAAMTHFDIGTRPEGWDKGGIRLRKPGTNRYLHLTGTGETTGTTYAWRGTREQAHALKAKARKRGEEWPWRGVRA